MSNNDSIESVNAGRNQNPSENRQQSKPRHISRTKEYRAWADMWQRCTNPKCKRYADYGGRGIHVTEHWRTFERFIADMGPAPSPEHSIDRRQNSRGYFRSNCRWANYKEQNRNRQNNRILEICDERKTLAEWCEIAGISRTTAANRLKRGWSPKDAFFKPIDQRQSRRGASK